MCLHRELQLLAQNKDRNSVSVLYFFNMKNYYINLGGSLLQSSLGCKLTLSQFSFQLTMGKNLEQSSSLIFIVFHFTTEYRNRNENVL